MRRSQSTEILTKDVKLNEHTVLDI